MVSLTLCHIVALFDVSLAGMAHDEVSNDPVLGQKRRELVESKAKMLTEARMITFNEREGTFKITDLGRIAAKYYIRTSSIMIYNKKLHAKMSEADILGVLSMSTEVSTTH